MKKITPINPMEGYRFAVYKHRLIIQEDKLITRQFIVLKNSNNIIIAFTRLHRHIKSKQWLKPISDDGNNRFYYVMAFLNHVLIREYITNQIDCLADVTLPMIQHFFTNYTQNTQNSKATVERCMVAVLDFLSSYIKANKHSCILKVTDFSREVQYKTKLGAVKKKRIPTFDVFYSTKPKTIFRDMPDVVLNTFLSYAAQYHKDIFFLMILSAFAGLRPSEACNVRQECSPLGSGISIRKVNGKATRIIIDLTQELNLRSDLLPVGKIKKERKQQVYPRYLNAFISAYEMHKLHLLNCKFEPQYCPMTVNRQGKAMTYDTYRKKFQQLTFEIIPLFLESGDQEVIEYAHDLQEHNISPHIFRHWFTVKLCTYGENVAGIQYWRGDRSPESALTYLQNKSEIKKQLQQVNNELFDFLKFSAYQGGQRKE
jgi:integrase